MTSVTGPASLLMKAKAEAEKFPLRLGVESFFFEDTELQSRFSSLLRQHVEQALAEDSEVIVVAQDRLDELMAQVRLQQLMQPDKEVPPFVLSDVDAVVRGRYYLVNDRIDVAAELVWLADGRLLKTSWSEPRAAMGRMALPSMPSATASLLEPDQLEDSRQLAEATGEEFARRPRDFAVDLELIGGARPLRANEKISFRVLSDRDCYIALINHQPDGSSKCLLPNAISSDHWIPGGRWNLVPDTHRFRFQLNINPEPPFGTEVFEVLACTEQAPLAHALEKFQQPAGGPAVVMRGAYVDALDEEVVRSESAQWASARLVVSSHE